MEPEIGTLRTLNELPLDLIGTKYQIARKTESTILEKRT